MANEDDMVVDLEVEPERTGNDDGDDPSGWLTPTLHQMYSPQKSFGASEPAEDAAVAGDQKKSDRKNRVRRETPWTHVETAKNRYRFLVQSYILPNCENPRAVKWHSKDLVFKELSLLYDEWKESEDFVEMVKTLYPSVVTRSNDVGQYLHEKQVDIGKAAIEAMVQEESEKKLDSLKLEKEVLEVEVQDLEELKNDLAAKIMSMKEEAKHRHYYKGSVAACGGPLLPGGAPAFAGTPEHAGRHQIHTPEVGYQDWETRSTDSARTLCSPLPNLQEILDESGYVGPDCVQDSGSSSSNAPAAASSKRHIS
jgi:hypothetical protein